MATATSTRVWDRDFTRERHTFDPERWELLNERRPPEAGEFCVDPVQGEAPDGLPVMKAIRSCEWPFWIVRPKEETP